MRHTSSVYVHAASIACIRTSVSARHQACDTTKHHRYHNATSFLYTCYNERCAEFKTIVHLPNCGCNATTIWLVTRIACCNTCAFNTTANQHTPCYQVIAALCARSVTVVAHCMLSPSTDTAAPMMVITPLCGIQYATTINW
jgi:hypothetical protein